MLKLEDEDTNEIYLTRFPSGEGKWQVSTDGGRDPRWSADGDRIYYRQGQDLMEVPVSGGASPSLGQPRKLFSWEAIGRGFDLTPDGERFAAVVDRGIRGSDDVETRLEIRNAGDGSVSEAWLREWVDPAIDSDTLISQLTMAGLEVDGWRDAAPALSGVVVADVVGVDNSPLAVKVCRKRGVRRCEVTTFARALSPGHGLGPPFDTVLMMGNNFGLVANERRCRWLLRRLRNLMPPTGRIVAQSTGWPRVCSTP